MQLLLLVQFLNVFSYQVKAKHFLIETEAKGENRGESNPRRMVMEEQVSSESVNHKVSTPNTQYLLSETGRTLASERISEESYLYDYGPRK